MAASERGTESYEQRAREIALFRYALIREAADPALSSRARGQLVRAIAAREHAGPFGAPVRISRETLDRWVRAWRAGGFDALVPSARRVAPRTPAELLELAVALKREAPARTAAQVAAVLRASGGWSPSERTLQRQFARLGLATGADGTAPAVFGRFEAGAVNELWTGDALRLSWQPDEAEGSLARETPGKAASSPDNVGTRWHCQTARVRLARRKGVREKPAGKAS